MQKAIELPVFHPCVRLARWRERPGELSFVPPDGKFMLAGYEVNLLPLPPDLNSWARTKLQLPVSIEVDKSLGVLGADFEVRLTLSTPSSGVSSSTLPSRPTFGSRSSGRSTPVFGGTSSAPTLHDVKVNIPISAAARNVIDFRASRGEAYFNLAENMVEWRIPTKDAATTSMATLRCTVLGPLTEGDEEGESNDGFYFSPQMRAYDETEQTYQTATKTTTTTTTTTTAGLSNERDERRDYRKIQQNFSLMPSSATVSFSVKGWLASGIRVDGLVVNVKKSRGLGEGLKPYKGVKYLTVSRKGVETRC